MNWILTKEVKEKLDQSLETVEVNQDLEEGLRPEDSPAATSEESLRRSGRQRQPPIRYGVDEYADVAKGDYLQHTAYNVCQISEPRTIDEALKGDHAKEWKAAADSEYDSLMANETWELVELPEGHKAIGCKWVFKVKYGSHGKAERFKGRLVAKGYAQKYGIDYEETFSPVVRFTSIRSLLAFAVQNDMLIHQMDVVTAFLNGKLDEEIYMEQPEGYVIAGKENLVCKLKKSLYGLKQSPRCWYSALREYLESMEFKQSEADPCVYIRTVGTMTVIAVYVDDLILTTVTAKEMQKVKESLAVQFKMTDMGKLHYCLGVSIVQDENRKCVWLHQKQYVQTMLEKYGMAEAKITSTPADLSVKLQKDDGVSKGVDANCLSINGWKLTLCSLCNTSGHCSGSGSSVKVQLKTNRSPLDSCKAYSQIPEGNCHSSSKIPKV